MKAALEEAERASTARTTAKRPRTPTAPRSIGCTDALQSRYAARFVLPAFALLLLVLFSPVGYGLWFSLFRIQYGAPTDFAGLENYIRLLDDPVLRARSSAAPCTVAGGRITIVISLALAVWINRLRRVSASSCR